jgi:hypothetical protein
MSMIIYHNIKINEKNTNTLCICNPKVKAHYNDPLYVIILYCFSRWSFLSLNHIKVSKDFHNVFTYHDKAQPIKKNGKENQSFSLYIMLAWNIFAWRKYMSWPHIKNCKYIPKMIEMIFSIHEIYSGYFTFHFT